MLPGVRGHRVQTSEGVEVGTGSGGVNTWTSLLVHGYQQLDLGMQQVDAGNHVRVQMPAHVRESQSEACPRTEHHERA